MSLPAYACELNLTLHVFKEQPCFLHKTTYRSALFYTTERYYIPQTFFKLRERRRHQVNIFMASNGSESKPLAIKYCLLSACSACCSVVFAVIGVSLVTQKRFKDFSLSTMTITGIFFLSLALLSTIIAVIFKRIYKYHYDRNIVTSHGPLVLYTPPSELQLVWHKYNGRVWVIIERFTVFHCWLLLAEK